MTSNSAAPRVAAVELPADPQSPLYSAPTYEAVQTGNTGSAAGQGTTGATGTAPLSDQLAYATSTQQTALSHRNLDFYDLPEDDAGLVAEPADAQLLSADSQQQTTTQPGSDGDIPTAPQAPPATLHPDAPPAYLDAPHDASEPPTYVPPPPAAPAVTPSEAARAAAALHAADPAKTMQSQSWAQIFESMREPGRAGLLYWAFVADILFAILIGLALLAYSVKPLAWRYYGGINGNATNEAYVALWGACITNNATGVADCSFTWVSKRCTCLVFDLVPKIKSPFQFSDFLFSSPLLSLFFFSSNSISLVISWGTNAFKNYYSQSLLFAVPTVPTFSWFCVMTIGFLTAGLLRGLFQRGLWSCRIRIVLRLMFASFGIPQTTSGQAGSTSSAPASACSFGSPPSRS